MKNHTLVLCESKIIISGLSLLLKENGFTPIVKSGTIPGYDLTLDIDELYVDNEDLERSKKYVEVYKQQIEKID